jgi:hypothetical protein
MVAGVRTGSASPDPAHDEYNRTIFWRRYTANIISSSPKEPGGNHEVWKKIRLP